MNERRSASRISSGVHIRYASYKGVRPPDESFESGITRNLSTGGVSFFCKQALELDSKVILLLGSELSPIAVLADVVHCQADHLADTTDFFVGCEFLARL